MSSRMKYSDESMALIKCYVLSQTVPFVKSLELVRTFQNKLDFYFPDTVKPFICIN